MNAHLGKIPPEARLEIAALHGGERRAAPLHRIDRRPRRLAVSMSPCAACRKFAPNSFLLLGLTLRAFALGAAGAGASNRPNRPSRDHRIGDLVGFPLEGIVDGS